MGRKKLEYLPLWNKADKIQLHALDAFLSKKQKNHKHSSWFPARFYVYFLLSFLLFYLFAGHFPVVAQDSTIYTNQSIPRSFHKKRFTGVMVAGASAYAITMVGLNEAWYKNNGRTHFHFFNDLHQWQQVDKAGHFYSAYHLSHTSARIFEWTGISSRQSVWLGAISGVLMMLPIEIQDGFSGGYGASWSDMAANTAGAAFSLQRLWWEQPRIHPKFSFHLTSFAPLRPGTLGENLPQRILKDYNGQTYWLDFDIQPWLGRESKFPHWLTLSLGYGANNMLYADKNINQWNGYDTYRQYYLSAGINFTRIPVENKFLKSLFYVLNTIHIPAPAIEFNKKGMKVHPLYF